MHKHSKPSLLILDTDKLFGGQTAFPESSTLVTGLKYKNKYQGFTPEKKYDPESVR